MGDKPHKLAIKVDLSCCRCRKAIQDYLCRLQRKVCMQIVSIEYDLKKDVVLVSCLSDPEELKRKLLCKLPKVIKGIDIIKPPPPPVDEKKKVFMNKCEEQYKEIRKREENCKKGCEKKCMKECEDPFNCKCNRKCECPGDPCKCKCNRKCECPGDPCKCKCNRKCECPGDPCKCKCNRKCECPTQPQPNQPPKLQLTIVCCAHPCPCWIAWSNCYRCCSCGVESWPGQSGPSCGSGPSYGGTRQWSHCEQRMSNNIIIESEQQNCRIM